MPPTRPIVRSGLVIALVCAASTASADDAPTFADRADEAVLDVDRGFALFLNPLAMASGLYGAEADIVLGRLAVLAIEAALYRLDDSMGEAVTAGLLVYPLGAALHRLYVEPRIAYAHPRTLAMPDWSADVVGFGATAGWQWTWDYGFSLRIGGGIMYFSGGPQVDASNGPPAVGPRIVLDGSVGWAF